MHCSQSNVLLLRQESELPWRVRQPDHCGHPKMLLAFVLLQPPQAWKEKQRLSGGCRKQAEGTALQGVVHGIPSASTQELNGTM